MISTKVPPSINGRPLVIVTRKDKIEALCRNILLQLTCAEPSYRECKSHSLSEKERLIETFMKGAFRGVRSGKQSQAAEGYWNWVYKYWENLATREGVSTLLTWSMCCSSQIHKAGILLAVFVIQEVIVPLETTKLAHQVRKLNKLLGSMGEVDI